MSHTTDLLDLLVSHTGRATGIKASDVAEQLGVSTRQVRERVTALRLDGIAVCGTPETGYFIAACAEELEETCQFLRSRSMHALMLEARLRRIPLPDLLGQIHLPT